MSERLFRLKLADSTTWAVVASSIAGARMKADRYFPNEHVVIEESNGGGPWRLADAGCATCPAGDVMPDLGHACATSCGRAGCPSEAD